MPITVTIDGLEQLKKDLDPVRAMEQIRKGLIRGAIRVQQSTVRKLSGPVLKNQTGTLRRSIHYRLVEDDKGVDALVGSFAGYPNPKGGEQAAGYARIHEYGGTFQVPAHTRRVTQIFGRQVEPFEQTVRAHTVTYPERSFLRSSVRDEKKNIVLELRNAMNAALAGR